MEIVEKEAVALHQKTILNISKLLFNDTKE